MLVCKFLFWISAFIIFFAMIGYPLLLIVLDRVKRPSPHKKDYSYIPTVTLMIVAHNEEKVIAEKLDNALKIDYPHDLMEILVASDNSDDQTNSIVESYIAKNPNRRIRLYKAEKRMGKTNAQNEAQKTVDSEILVMTDANSIFKHDAIRELVSVFIKEDIVYVCGKLVYTNDKTTLSSKAESTYWDLDLKLRDIESRLRTITAGNGAIYACRNSEYIHFDPIECHDSSMPLQYGLDGKRALFNPDAIALEKAGETTADEFKRKVRMNRMITKRAWPNIKTMNIRRCGWFSLFYFGHRTCRYQLWMAHFMLLLSSLTLAVGGNAFYLVMLTSQIVLYLLALIYAVRPIKIPGLRMLYYYCITVVAQLVGVVNCMSGKSRPFWEKAESTR